MSDIKLKFANRVGAWHRWFAWHPDKTYDNRWVWLRFVWRATYQTHDFLYHDSMTKFFILSIEDPRGRQRGE